MQIFLLILKIIGIVLLSVIGLILFLLALILFVPIRYKLLASRDDNESDFIASTNISYLLHIVSVWITYNKELDFKVKIFGINIKKFSRDKKEKEKPEILTDNDYTVEWNDTDKADGDISESQTTSDENTKSQDSDEVAEIEASESDKEGLWNRIIEYINRVVDFIITIPERIWDFLDGLEDFLDDLVNRFDKFEKKLYYYERMYNDSRNRKAVLVIWNEIKYLLNGLLPKRIKGRVHFGFEDPSTTGQILAYLGMSAPFIPGRLSINPDFEYEGFEGNIEIKGSFPLIKLLISCFRLYFNKDVRRLYRLYKKNSRK